MALCGGELKYITKEDCTYTSCYCEENVWFLCQRVKERCAHELCNTFAVFVSNPNKKIPLWHQRSSRSPDGVVVWDYHVIFIHHSDKAWVYDLDTKLEFPCEFPTYASSAVRSDNNLPPEFRRLFRVVNAEAFLQTFASDRSHMLTRDHTWLSPPPVYPCIRTQDCSNNLSSFINMEDSDGVGEVMSTEKFIERFSGNKSQ